MSEIYDLAILGAGPAGISAAIYAARAQLNTLWVEKKFAQGGQIVDTYEVDNYPGMPGINGLDLGEAMASHAEKLGLTPVRENVISIELEEGIKIIRTRKNEYRAKTLILAMGAAHRTLDIPGEQELGGMGVSYCATCDGMLYRGKPVAVVGYTDTARQEAEFLQKIGCSVTYFDRPKQCEIRGDGRVESVTCDGRTIPAEGVFILRPTMAPTELFPGLAVEQGYVTVDRRMATNLPGLFAAGDCTGGPLQVSKAAGDGLIAGQSAAAWAAAQERREKQS